MTNKAIPPPKTIERPLPGTLLMASSLFSVRAFHRPRCVDDNFWPFGSSFLLPNRDIYMVIYAAYDQEDVCWLYLLCSSGVTGWTREEYFSWLEECE